ncbi:MetQ/NlpA family ABC transporter substrate-binding protein, partial [Xanthomonas campestris pv. campestris]|nr:MetQ/NlpA family ABC transporter substrate-binding protein [Xanthomonas campestris pv. campestris]
TGSSGTPLQTSRPCGRWVIGGFSGATNYALDAGLNPTRDALAIESKDSPYVNFLVARADNKDDPRVQKLAKALTSPEVKAFIEQKYKGAVLPAF